MSEPKYSYERYTSWKRLKLRWWMFKRGRWIISEVNVNPYKPGSDEWHYHNLTGGSWGHTEEVQETEDGIHITGKFYTPEVLQMSNMGDLTADVVPWELRYSPSLQLTEAFKGFGEALEKVSYSAKDAAMTMQLYSIYGQPRRLRWYERLWDWLRR